MILQLNPLIEVTTNKGDGYAMFLIDYGMDQDLYWVVSLNHNGEIWTFANREIRMAKNITLGRTLEKEKEFAYYGCL